MLVVFDYRRYQNDVVQFARQCAAQGVTVLLFTDPWLSPIAENAEVTIICPLEVPSPYDTMAPAIAQIEALATQMLSTIDDATRKRVERLEKIRRTNAVTLDGEDTIAAGKAGGRDFPGPKTTKQG
jgi:DNA-binding MurR/RpiR family transcriptional regulator